MPAHLVEHLDPEQEAEQEAVETPAIPEGWRKGCLLNVRDYGAEYIVTAYPEEFDNEQPHRALRFTNVGECQNFISAWYSRESHDPRAR